MAHRSIEILIGRLVTDEAFRGAFLTDAPGAIHGFMESGYALTELEIAAVTQTRQDLWTLVADRIDPRLQRASIPSRSQS